MQTLRSKHRLTKLFCLVFALTLCAPQFIAIAQTGTQSPAQQTRPVSPPRQYIPNRNYDTRHIKLDLRFDWEREQALALGETKNAAAYESLVKFLDVPSWRDQIRTSALLGLANLGDKRAFELGNRYLAAANPPQVRAAAITLLASVGKDDPRTFQIISDALSFGASTLNFTISNAAGEALVKLGDPRGVDAIEQAIKKTNNPQMQGFIRQFQQRLRQSTPKSSGQ